MSSADALGVPPTPNRVYYSLGRMLGVEDFQADQDYHRGRLARALLLLCGTGTVAGLKVRVPQQWEANAAYPTWSFVIDASGFVWVNAGAPGTSGDTVPAWTAAPGTTSGLDGNVTWTNEGKIQPNPWTANTPFSYPFALTDQIGNLQILNVVTGFISGAKLPVWNVNAGGQTADGTSLAAWTCLGSATLEVAVTPGMAVDRVGRIIEVPRAVCVPLDAWLKAQMPSDLGAALHGANILIDVFATFVGCTRGVTPCFASRDDYDATDAFSPNRLLDSFAMQLVLRTDAAPQTPADPWLGIGPMTTAPNLPPKTLQAGILNAVSGPGSAAARPVEYPPNFDATSVFLARLAVPATAPTTAGAAPAYSLSNIAIDNFSRLFLYASSLAARWNGLGSGAES